MFLAALMIACEQRPDSAPPPGAESMPEPSITASPLAGNGGQPPGGAGGKTAGDERGGWQIAASDYITLKVEAPGAQSARILYRPVAAGDQYVELKTLDTPSNAKAGEFSARLRLAADFAGDMWAEVEYRDGAERDTGPISLARSTTAASESQPPAGNPAEPSGPSRDSSGAASDSKPAPPDNTSAAADHSKPAPLDKSALSDEITRGKIERAAFQSGQPDIRIDVNVPAFQLCLWQNGKLVNIYEIGVGRKDFPIDISNRRISQIIFNPEWVPPDSSWVIKNPKVSPGERIPASDKRNPLGKIKIPLGEGYLIHQTEKTADIGHLVSHGCIRMQEADLIDLADKLIAAQSLPIGSDKIQHALDSRDRLAVALKRSIPISIRYDTLVVQQGILHVYPDVYGRGTNTAVEVRSDLSAAGVDASRIDDATLSQMMDRANKDQEYAVAAADIKAGAELTAGHVLPLTSHNKQPSPGRTARGTKARSARHARSAGR
jgi:lipoprotein-anchoring transpeptidase ErfK/SrfK